MIPVNEKSVDVYAIFIIVVADAPQLLEVEKAVTSQGLKNPWFRYGEWGTPIQRILFFQRGSVLKPFKNSFQ